MTYLLAIFGLSALGVLADWFLKLSGERSPAHVGWFSVGAFLYLLCAPGWLFVMRRVPLSGIGAPYAVSNVLLLVAVGVFAFHERLSITEVLGIGFALLSVVMLHRLF
jgi:multidrug transporter EmrE-like cation transporter